MSPRVEICTFASSSQTDLVVKTLTLENDKMKLKKFTDDLRNAIGLGHWVIVENVHVVKEWPRETLNLLFVGSFFIKL